MQVARAAALFMIYARLAKNVCGTKTSASAIAAITYGQFSAIHVMQIMQTSYFRGVANF
jgi:hypothetical protein